MFPTFELFGKTIGLYAVMSLIGAFICGIYSCKIARKNGYDDNDIIVLLLISAVGALIGGHLLYGITNIDKIIKLFDNWHKITGFKEFFDVMIYIFGGSVFYGGLIGGITAGFIYLKNKKLCIPEYTDIVAPAIPLFHGFGRIGCFLGGCCYGIECKIGFIYNNSLVAEANNIRRFPVQLAESLFNFILFFILYKLYKKNKFKNRLLLLYIMSYSAGRFVLEFLRGDEIRGFIYGISTSQFISIILFTISITALVVKYKKKVV